MIFPLILIKKLLKHSEKLDSYSNRLSLAFIYKEYKTEFFYWEFIRVAVRILVIFFANFYYSLNRVKASLIQIVLAIYIVAL